MASKPSTGSWGCGIPALSRLWRRVTSAPGITRPIAAAWLYMSDDNDYRTIPSYWSAIDFKLVDILVVGPAGIQEGGYFGLYASPTTGSLDERLGWVVGTARAQNPNIKILISQWWGDGTGLWGSALDALPDSQAIDHYTTSVADFLGSWMSISGGVDGYDIDYEDNNVSSNAVAILSQIRNKLDALGRAAGRQFYVTVSPGESSHLAQAVPSLDYVNIQTYAGASGQSPQEYLDLGLKAQQLLYGICPESDCGGPSLDEAKEEYSQNRLAGIHLWRLNSGNYEEELQMQAKVYAFLHPVPERKKGSTVALLARSMELGRLNSD